MTSQNFSTNESIDYYADSANRPYGVGLKRHHEAIATILVYKEGKRIERTERVDYLDRLDRGVDALTIAVGNNTRGEGAISVDTPDNSAGEIINSKLDGRNEYYGIFNNFSLLNVSESHEQIVKMHVNFGADWNAFFFGEQPRVYQFSGIFIDSMEYPYYQEFMVAYDKYLCGRKSIENKIRTKFIYDGKIVDGYMLNIRTSQTAADQLIKNFEFTVLVKGFNWIRTNLIPSLTKLSNGVEITRMVESFNGLSNAHRLSRENLTDIISHTRRKINNNDDIISSPLLDRDKA